ncbi:hypothetical protein [Methylocucumis oryzae]|uniref:hypothetical protein n=1 Tax=Methylocucumis oryzae TaxID=1632867 RepID=UPI00069735D0|nr:hypothetical protein [Methylocucumis oryzae]
MPIATRIANGKLVLITQDNVGAVFGFVCFKSQYLARPTQRNTDIIVLKTPNTGNGRPSTSNPAIAIVTPIHSQSSLPMMINDCCKH